MMRCKQRVGEQAGLQASNIHDYTHNPVHVVFFLSDTMHSILKCPITRVVLKDPVLLDDGQTYDQAVVSSKTGRPNRLRALLVQMHNDTGKLPPADWDGYCCPITHCVMNDPVVTDDGCTYERCELLHWLRLNGGISPLTRLPVTSVVPDHMLRTLIRSHQPPPTWDSEQLDALGCVFEDILQAMLSAARRLDTNTLSIITTSLRVSGRLGLPGPLDPLMPIRGLGLPLERCTATRLLAWVAEILQRYCIQEHHTEAFCLIHALVPTMTARYRTRLAALVHGFCGSQRLYWVQQLQDVLIAHVHPACSENLCPTEAYDMWLRCQQAIDSLCRLAGPPTSFCVAHDLESLFLEVLHRQDPLTERVARAIRRRVHSAAHSNP